MPLETTDKNDIKRFTHNLNRSKEIAEINLQEKVKKESNSNIFSSCNRLESCLDTITEQLPPDVLKQHNETFMSIYNHLGIIKGSIVN